MTEQKWWAATEPQAMLQCVRRRASKRKLRLFASACCRRGQSILRSHTTREALEALEAYADNLITRKVMEERRAAWYGRFDYPFPIAGTWNSALAYATITHTKVWAAEAADHAARATKKPEKERAIQAQFLRDIFGNPFCPVTVDAEWLTPLVVALATGIYHERAFDRLPILADALEEAGCGNAAILGHCRSDGPHVRGCWVVDQLLAKG